MRNLLYRRYQTALLRRHDAGGGMGSIGGVPIPNGIPGADLTMQVSQFGTNLIDTLKKPDEYGLQSNGTLMAKDVLNFGAVGLLKGVFDGKANTAARNNAMGQMAMNVATQDKAQSTAALGADPSLATGHKGVQYFATGGPLDPVKPVTGAATNHDLHNAYLVDDINYTLTKGLFNGKRMGSYDADENKLLQSAYIYGQTNKVRDPQTIISGFYGQTQPSDGTASLRQKLNTIGYGAGAMYNSTPNMDVHANGGLMQVGKMIDIDKYPRLPMKADGGALNPGKEGSDAWGLPVTYGKDLGSNQRTPLNDLITSGGTAKKLSSDNALIKGNSHAEGGIDIPELDAEVEGGETTLNNFVFSKKLGFADLHKPIATAKGKIENKPRTLERANSMRMLINKESQLAEQQELLKKKLGIR